MRNKYKERFVSRKQFGLCRKRNVARQFYEYGIKIFTVMIIVQKIMMHWDDAKEHTRDPW